MHGAAGYNHPRPCNRSCSGATIRSNSDRRTRGSWICASKVRPPLARRIVKAGTAALRPQAITKSGHGGASNELPPEIAYRGKSHNCGGNMLHGRCTLSGFSTKEQPVASARPRAWLLIPGLPSCSTQAFGSAAPAAGSDQQTACAGKEAINLVFSSGRVVGIAAASSGRAHARRTRRKSHGRDVEAEFFECKKSRIRSYRADPG